MARFASMGKLGFFPYPTAALKYVSALFNPASHSDARLLDPCAGEGEAAQAISSALNLKPYTNEYQRSRAEACVKKFGPIQAVRDDIFTLQATSGAFDLMWLNPPFQESDSLENSKGRTEHEFLEHSLKWVYQDGGYLAFVCYTHHIRKEVAYTLYRQFETVDVYLDRELHLNAYGLVTIIAKAMPGLRESKEAHALADALVERADINTRYVHAKREDKHYTPDPHTAANLFEDIAEAATGGPRYTFVQPRRHKAWSFTFRAQHVDHYGLASWLAQYGPHTLPAFAKLITPAEEKNDFEVVIMPRKKQLAGLLAAGLFNGVILETEKGRAAVRSVVRQIERLVDSGNADLDEEEYDEDGELVEEEDKESVTRYITAPEVTITLLYEDGTIENISTDEKIAAFIAANSAAMMAHVNKTFRSLYNFDFVGGITKQLLDDLRLKKGEPDDPDYKEFTLLEPQKHVVSALYSKLRRDKAMTLVGEMGTGKTVISASLMEAMRYRTSEDPLYSVFQAIPAKSRIRPDQFNIVVCPPHLVEKHMREIRSISPDAFIGAVKSGEGEKPIDAVMNFINRLAFQPADRLKVLIISREMMKVGDGWTPAYNVRKRRNRVGMIEQFLVDPNTGLELMEPSRNKDNERPIALKTLQNNRRFVGVKKGTNFQPKRGKKVRAYGGRNSELANVMSQAARWPNERAHLLGRFNRETRAARQHWDSIQPAHTPLWQEDRTFSKLKADPRHLLMAKMQTSVPVVPLPDLVLKHLDTVEYRPARNPRGPLDGVAKLLASRYGHLIYLAIFDEFHEYASPTSAQGQAMTVLANAASKVIGMTGTLYRGVASSLYSLEYMINPRVRFTYPRSSGGPKLWVEHMGVLERVVKNKKTSDGRNTSKSTQTETVSERPGASPALLAEIIDHTIFFGILDVAEAMPAFEEEGVEIEMEGQMAAIYTDAEGAMKGYLIERIREKGDTSFLGAYFQGSLNWINYPFKEYPVIHRMTVEDPETGEEKIVEKLIYTYPALPEGTITTKERKLLEEIRAELAAGRGVAVYARQTGDPTKLLKRLERLIKQEVKAAKPAILTSRVKTGQREEWLEKNKDKNVLLCNANLVKTGLDMLQFPTILWFELEYSLTTMDQASHRAWRLGQDKDCKVKYLYYMRPEKVKRHRSGDTIDITGMSVEQAADVVMEEFGVDAGSLASHAISDAMMLFMGTERSEEYGDYDPEPREIKLYDRTTMEAKGLALMDQKRKAAGFLYGAEGASLSALTDSGSSDLRKMLAEAMDKEMTVDSSTLFRKSAGFTTMEPDWVVQERQPIVANVTLPEPKVGAEPVLLQVGAFTTDEEVATDPPVNVKPEADRVLQWAEDVKKYGKPRLDGTEATFYLGRGRMVRWIKLEDGCYERLSIDSGATVYVVRYAAKAA